MNLYQCFQHIESVSGIPFDYYHLIEAGGDKRKREGEDVDIVDRNEQKKELKLNADPLSLEGMRPEIFTFLLEFLTSADLNALSKSSPLFSDEAIKTIFMRYTFTVDQLEKLPVTTQFSHLYDYVHSVKVETGFIMRFKKFINTPYTRFKKIDTITFKLIDFNDIVGILQLPYKTVIFKKCDIFTPLVLSNGNIVVRCENTNIRGNGNLILGPSTDVLHYKFKIHSTVHVSNTFNIDFTNSSRLTTYKGIALNKPLPNFLKKVVIENDHGNNEITQNMIPSQLEHLEIEDHGPGITSLEFPNTLKTLILYTTYNHPIKLHEGLESFQLRYPYDYALTFPSTLLKLVLAEFNRELNLPWNLQQLELGDRELGTIYLQNDLKLPDSLRKLDLVNINQNGKAIYLGKYIETIEWWYNPINTLNFTFHPNILSQSTYIDDGYFIRMTFTHREKQINSIMCSVNGCINKGIYRTKDANKTLYCSEECQIKDWYLK